jgi:hypothetical protein
MLQPVKSTAAVVVFSLALVQADSSIRSSQFAPIGTDRDRNPREPRIGMRNCSMVA